MKNMKLIIKYIKLTMKEIAVFILLFSFYNSDAQITSYPYVSDFEYNSNGFYVNGTNSSWELGNPDESLIINSAASGTRAWVTNLDGNYSDNESGYVLSPVFDLSSLTLPMIQLKIWWNCEFGWDGAVLQSTIDNGLSWQNVGNFGDSNNWYNSDYIEGSPGGQYEGWTGRGFENGSNGWVTATNSLSYLTGQSNVRFRVAFGSDNSVVDEGFAFDDFKIYEQNCYAGENNTISICLDGSNPLILDLNTLLSEGATLGGNWYNSGYPYLPITYDGIVDLSSVNQSRSYQFEYRPQIQNYCNDYAWFTLNVELPAFAGSDTITSVCSAEEELNLAFFLEENVSSTLGVWTNLNEPEVPLTSIGVADFNGLEPGSYEFSYTVVSDICGSTDTAIKTIVIESFSAGEDGILNVCDFSEDDLFNALGGSPGSGGFWSPPIDGPGNYTYTQPATANCEETSATVVVNQIVQLSAGTDKTIESCSESSLDEFLVELGGDEGGIWSPNDYQGSGIYTYTHPATDCTVESSATLTFTIPDPPNAGPDSSVFGSFGSDNLNDMRDQLRSTHNDSNVDEGIWVQIPNGSPNVLMSSDGEVDFPNTGAGAAQLYEFEYQVSGECQDDFATVIVSIFGEDTAGIDGTLVICLGDNFSYNSLFDELGGNPSIRGYWVEPIDGPGIYTYIAQDNSYFDADSAQIEVIEDIQKSAGVDASLNICEGETLTNAELFTALGATADEGGTWNETSTGVYVYSHAATDCYPEVSATVTLIEEPQKSAGVDASLNICEGETLTNTELFTALGTTADEGGTWNETSAGVYVYTHAATTCYPEVSATVTLIEEPQKSAGVDASLNICEGETLTNAELFTALGATADEGGTWNETSTGVYEYSHAETDCYTSQSAIVTVIVESQLSAGEDGELEIANGATVSELELFNALEGNPDSGGTWTPEPAGEGTYTYTHAGGVCLESSAEVVVFEGALAIKDEYLNSIRVYPNPVKSVVKIANSKHVAIKTIELYTITGQLVMRVDSNFTEIKVSKLESAMYFLQIKTEFGQKIVKFIKE